MSVTFSATVGLTQNSYCTVEDADDYHAKRLFTSDWDSGSTANKQKALMQATKILDEMVDWDGTPTQDSTLQALQWPRDGVYDRHDVELDETTIPQFLKEATAELARNLIAEDRAGQNKVVDYDLKEMNLGSGQIDMKFGNAVRKVITDYVRDMIAPWGKLKYQGVIGASIQRA